MSWRLSKVSLTIKQAIDSIFAAVPGPPFPGTVDTITHDPSLHTPRHDAVGRAANPLYPPKPRLAEDGGLVIWPSHDTLPRINPAPTRAGRAHELGWEPSLLPGQPTLCGLPAATTLR